MTLFAITSLTGMFGHELKKNFYLFIYCKLRISEVEVITDSLDVDWSNFQSNFFFLDFELAIVLFIWKIQVSFNRSGSI